MRVILLPDYFDTLSLKFLRALRGLRGESIHSLFL